MFVDRSPLSSRIWRGDSSGLNLSWSFIISPFLLAGQKFKRGIKNGRQDFENRQSCQKGAYRMKKQENVAHASLICKKHLFLIPKYQKIQLYRTSIKNENFHNLKFSTQEIRIFMSEYLWTQVYSFQQSESIK